MKKLSRLFSFLLSKNRSNTYRSYTGILMEKIELSGSHSGKIVYFDSRLHTELSDGFYRKDDTENVVKVEGRFYRKNSPLIVVAHPDFYGVGSYLLKSDSIPCGEYNIHNGDTVTVKISKVNSDGVASVSQERFHHKERFCTVYDFDAVRTMTWSDANYYIEQGFVVTYASEMYMNSFCVMVENRDSKGRGFVPINHIISKSIRNGTPYEKVIEILKKEEAIREINGKLWLASYISYSLDPKGKAYKPLYCSMTKQKFDSRDNPVIGIMSIEKSQRSSIDSIIKSGGSNVGALNQLLRKRIFSSIEVDSDFKDDYNGLMLTPFSGVTVSSEEDCIMMESLYHIIKNSSISEEVTERKNKVIGSHWFKGITEKTPKLFTSNTIGGQGGDYVYFRGKSKLEMSKTTNLTGGLGFTFGVEIETSAGVVPMFQAEILNCDIVGDRSIGSMEYVTGVLHGDDGMNNLMNICETISDYCLVDDRCGVHVHVGTSKRAQPITFDKRFSVYAVMLGCQIEEELFGFMPPNRMEGRNSSGLPYCGSILEYSNMSTSNWKDLLEHYVFSSVGNNPFSSLDETVSKNHRVNRWATGRYKWLNLINCLTSNEGRRSGSAGFQTIEFRAFNATCNPVDIRVFVLIALSFTEFCISHRDKIDAGKVTISSMLGNTLDSPSYEMVMDWISKRKSLIAKIELENKQAKVKS